ncbi:MAG TPA: hypothetical protein VGI26_08310 [Solirubrobacteraceae bacterium]|jgi:hypothetical protein
MRPLDVGRALSSYLDKHGRLRELLTLPGHGGSVLVLDRDAATLCDRRLVAHLAADEPPENVALVCRHYLEDPAGRWCRRVQREDLLADPIAVSTQGAVTPDPLDISEELTDEDGRVYSIGLFSAGEGSTAQLQWCRGQAAGAGPRIERVPLRDVIAVFERYEPMRALTEQALARHGDDPDLLVTRLRSEFERLCASPVVLNRGLREAVLHATDSLGLSLSEIAFRCGVVKRDRNGKTSGETSWVARRIGLMPEGGEKRITPWVHIDVLATIARKGLGVSPREVELQ